MKKSLILQIQAFFCHRILIFLVALVSVVLCQDLQLVSDEEHDHHHDNEHHDEHDHDHGSDEDHHMKSDDENYYAGFADGY